MIRAAAFFLALVHPAGASAGQLAKDRISAVIEAADFDGDIAISTELSSSHGPGYAFIGTLPEPFRGGDDGLSWRWASVTKQMVAILVMQQVERGAIDLDKAASEYLPGFKSPNATSVTIRQLLQHRSGLPNPDTAGEFPGAYYRADFAGDRDPLTGFCAGPVIGQPGGEWSYNNCDYMVLGAVLEKVTGLAWGELFVRDIARPLGLTGTGAYPGEKYTRWGLIDDVREPGLELSAYGASAGLYGTPEDLIAIDKALMRGDLLGPDALAEMWRSDPALGYMALGQWVFEAPLKGCKSPVLIVERRGDIGAIQVRNFMLPDKQIAVVAFSQSKPFEFGEVWRGGGFSHDLLSAAACPEEAP